MATAAKNTRSADTLFPEAGRLGASFDSLTRDWPCTAPSPLMHNSSNGYENVLDSRRRHFRQRSYSQDIGRPPVAWSRRKLSAGETPPPQRPPLPREVELIEQSPLSRKDSRRRTWSPPAFSRMMGSAGSAIRSFRSNDHLEAPGDENIYEELESVLGGVSPCKLAPVSGKLTKQNAHRSLIKPVAFKPILPAQSSTPKRYMPHQPLQQYPSPRMNGASTPSAASAASSSSQPNPPAPRSMHSSPGSSAQPSPPGPQHAASSPQLYTSVRTHSLDDGYASQDYHYGDRPLAVTYVSDFHSHMESASAASSQSKFSSSEACASNTSHGDSFMTTPSPSDSGVGEVEALIRSKEEELVKLRDTMEKNEAAIMQVHAERQQNWMMEMREVTEQWESRLRAQQQKAFRSEQGLIMQLFKLQQERKQIKADSDELRASKDAISRELVAVKRECEALKAKTEETAWSLQQKAGEISLLKAQLKEAKEEASSKSSSVLDLKTQLRESAQERDSHSGEVARLRAECERTQGELQTAKDIVQQTQRQLETIRKHTAAAVPATDDVNELRDQLQSALAELSSVQESQKKEREQWLEEKNKVIRYQKHLQLNYTQMHRKNKMLEAEIQQLTLELENRDLQLSDIPTEEAQESMC